MTHGLGFAEPQSLEILRRRGHLILMDCTQQTNKLSWLLYTLMVRDEYGSWIPGAHMMTAREDSDIVAVGFNQVSIFKTVFISF